MFTQSDIDWRVNELAFEFYDKYQRARQNFLAARAQGKEVEASKWAFEAKYFQEIVRRLRKTE